MFRTDVIEQPWGRGLSPIALAFLVSLVLHGAFFGFIEGGNRLGLWKFSPMAMLARALKLESIKSIATAMPAIKPPVRTKPAVEEPQEIPLVFVDVDPSQATAETPKDTRFYSAVNSLAANPVVADKAEPKFDGQQDKVLKTKDSERSAQRVAAVPLQPTPTVPEVSPAAKPPTEVAKIEAQPPKIEAVKPRPKTVEGDLETIKPAPPVAVAQPAPPAVQPQRERPRTVAAAKAMRQLNPDSALVGEQMKQEGGVSRFSVESSLSAQGTPLGNYDAKFVAAVQRCWNESLDEHRYTGERAGKVVLKFKLTSEGRIQDMETVESSVGEIYTVLCQLAVTKPAPYEKWPDEVRKLLRGNQREVTFTFHY